MQSKPNGIFLEAVANAGEGVPSQLYETLPFFLKSLPKGLGEVIAVQISGSSMEPKIPNGYIGLFYSPFPLPEKAEWVDHIYLVATKNSGYLVKYVTRELDGEGNVIGVNLHSLNLNLNLKPISLGKDDFDKLYKLYKPKNDRDFFAEVEWV